MRVQCRGSGRPRRSRAVAPSTHPAAAGHATNAETSALPAARPRSMAGAGNDQDACRRPATRRRVRRNQPPSWRRPARRQISCIGSIDSAGRVRPGLHHRSAAQVRQRARSAKRQKPVPGASFWRLSACYERARVDRPRRCSCGRSATGGKGGKTCGWRVIGARASIVRSRNSERSAARSACVSSAAWTFSRSS
jgi:hypothetical protein